MLVYGVFDNVYLLLGVGLLFERSLTHCAQLLTSKTRDYKEEGGGKRKKGEGEVEKEIESKTI